MLWRHLKVILIEMAKARNSAVSHQVWSLTTLLNLLFIWREQVNKSLNCLSANQWLLARETIFSSLPPSNSLVSISDPRRAFWADTAPFSGPRIACVASGTTEIQGHRQVCRARRGGPRTPSITTDTNLDCAFVENALFYRAPWFWKVNRIELS